MRTRILYLFVWLLSKLPFIFWYSVSYLLYLVVYYLLGYRKKVVEENLLRAFPEKNETTRKEIAHQYYRYLCDLLVETIKGASLSAERMKKRMHVENPEVLDGIRTGETGGIIVASHYGNFEWTNAGLDIASGNLTTYTIYHPLKNPRFEALMQRVRGRFGTQLIDKQHAFRAAIRHLKSPCLMGFVSDQSPSRRDSLYFAHFLNQATAMHEGAALLAVGRGYPAFFADVKRVRRGYYRLELIRIPVEDFTEKNDLAGFTDFHAALLEKRIRENPPYWLWSHKRWKHTPQPGDRGHITT